MINNWTVREKKLLYKNYSCGNTVDKPMPIFALIFFLHRKAVLRSRSRSRSLGFLAEAGADLNFDLADNLGLLQLLFLERENIFIFV